MVRRKALNIKMKRAKPRLTPTEEVTRHGPGRRGAFHEWMCEEAKDMCGKFGARIDDLATHFDVCPATIDYWIKNKHNFSRAVKQGRSECVLKMSRALFHRGIGYSHPAIHFMMQTIKEYDENGNVTRSITQPLEVPYIKHYPPDTPAAIKYLSILGRENGWAEITKVNMDVNHSGDINIHKVEELSMESLSEEVRALLFEINLKQLSDAQLQ